MRDSYARGNRPGRDRDPRDSRNYTLGRNQPTIGGTRRPSVSNFDDLLEAH